MTTSNNPLDDAAEALVSLIKNIGIEADDFNNSAVQQQEFSSKLADSLKKTFEASSKTSNDNFDAKMETVSQHLASMNNEIVEIAKVLKCAMSAPKWGGGDIDGSKHTSLDNESIQSIIRSVGNMGEKIAILNKRIDQLETDQRNFANYVRKDILMDVGSLKQELEKRVEVLEYQQPHKPKPQKRRLEQDLSLHLSRLEIIPSFHYSMNFHNSHQAVGHLMDGKELIKIVLTSFAAGVAYCIPEGHNIPSGHKAREVCRKDFRDKLLSHLKHVIGRFPRIEEEKSGNYTLHYV